MQTRLAADRSDVTVEVSLEGENAIDRLRGLKTADQVVERWLADAVGEARQSGASWTDIGDALGVTCQAAWKLYNAELVTALKQTRDQSGLTEEEALDLARTELASVRAHRRRR